MARNAPAHTRRGATYRRRLAIMVKEPVAGRVKTRLARDVGLASATGFYRHTLKSVVARLAADPRWHTCLSVAPAAMTTSRMLPAGVVRMPQLGGDLGQRMQTIFEIPERGPMVVIGTDIPKVTPVEIAQAFQALGRHDIVFGPATDGGFWLVGMRRSPRVFQLFHDVRWSTPHTLQDCLDGLRTHHGLRVATVATLSDADESADLEHLANARGRRLLPRAWPRSESRKSMVE